MKLEPRNTEDDANLDPDGANGDGNCHGESRERETDDECDANGAPPEVVVISVDFVAFSEEADVENTR